jgi:hypothetical protein
MNLFLMWTKTFEIGQTIINDNVVTQYIKNVIQNQLRQVTFRMFVVLLIQFQNNSEVAQEKK